MQRRRPPASRLSIPSAPPKQGQGEQKDTRDKYPTRPPSIRTAGRTAELTAEEKEVLEQVKHSIRLHIGTEYDPFLHPRLAHRIASLFGAGLRELADVFGVGAATVKRWMLKYPVFSQAVQDGMDEFDSKRVETALLQRVLGYDIEEMEVTESDKGVKVTTRIKHIPPDPGAIVFWLTNRRPDRWRRKVEAVGGGGGGDEEGIGSESGVLGELLDGIKEHKKKRKLAGKTGEGRRREFGVARMVEEMDVGELTDEELEEFEKMLKKVMKVGGEKIEKVDGEMEKEGVERPKELSAMLAEIE